MTHRYCSLRQIFRHSSFWGGGGGGGGGGDFVHVYQALYSFKVLIQQWAPLDLFLVKLWERGPKEHPLLRGCPFLEGFFIGGLCWEVVLFLDGSFI